MLIWHEDRSEFGEYTREEDRKLRGYLLSNRKTIGFHEKVVFHALNSSLPYWGNLYPPKTNSESKIAVDGVFVEMGYIAKTDIVEDLVQLNDNKEISVDKYGATSCEGIFAAGDVTDVPYKQAVISAGQGAIVVLSAYNYIQKLEGKPTVKTDWKSTKK